jgi:predicted nucleotidyltransferase
MCDKAVLKIVLDRIAKHSYEVFGASLRDVILFGSYARGDQDDESDIDIMILVDKDHDDLRHSRESFVRLISDLDLEYDVVISPCLKDYKTFAYWKNDLPFYQTVDTEGIRISA